MSKKNTKIRIMVAGLFFVDKLTQTQANQNVLDSYC